MDSQHSIPNLEEIKKVLHSLDHDDYIRFMKEVHFECPFKSKEMTDEIVHRWKNDHSMKAEEFKRMIKEREAEYNHKAEEKRLRDLVRIEDMKSKTGFDPLDLLLKEVWMLVFDKLPPEDKRNFRQVHKTFQNLTEYKLIGDVLLPLILGFQVKRFWGEPLRFTAPGGLIVERRLPCPLARYTELRLVSKTLRNAVDRWFEDDIISKLRSGNKEIRPTVVISANLQSIQDCRKFALMRSQLYSCPPPKLRRFFIRSLCIIAPKYGRLAIGADVAEELAAFSGIIDEILECIGDQIWYFSFEVVNTSLADRDGGERLFARSYISYLGWLKRMPNLKWLKLSLNVMDEESRNGLVIPEGVPPTLMKLERLDLRYANRYTLRAFTRILNANTHVKMLELFGVKAVLMNRFGFTSSLSPDILIMERSLSPIFPSHYNWNDDDDEEEEFTDTTLFKSIVQAHWPLQQIDWELRSGGMYIDEIFHGLGKVKTLEKISLKLDDVKIRDNTTYLELPQLNHFELRMKSFAKDDHGQMECSWRFWFSLQFLIFAKNLKTLNWACDMQEDERWAKVKKDLLDDECLGEMLDFDRVVLKVIRMIEDGGGIEESNIWRIFPSLDTVNLSMHVLKGSNHITVFWKNYVKSELKLKEKSRREGSSSNLEG